MTSDISDLSEIEIALAIPTDCIMLSEMSRVLIEHGLRWRWKASRILSLIRHPDCVVLKASSGSQLIGFAAMEFHELYGHLNLLAVKPVKQGNGIGRQLLGWLEQSAVIAGLNYISLEVRCNNAGAIRFYERHNYHIEHVSRKYYQGREDAFRMKHQLISHDIAAQRP